MARYCLMCLVSLFLSTLLGACAHDEANRYYADRRFEPKDPSEVEILWKRPARPFKVIADLQSRNETPGDMQEKAAELGADAVIVSTLGAIDYTSNEDWVRRTDDRDRPYTRIVGTAIIYE